MDVAPKSPQFRPEKDQKGTGWVAIAYRLTEPDARVPEAKRSQARLLSYLLLFLILSLFIIFPFAFLLPSFRNSNQYSIFIVIFAFLGLVYALSRTRHSAQAALLTVFISAAGVWLLSVSDSLIQNSLAKDLFYSAIPILFCSLLLGGRVTGMLTVFFNVAIIISGIFFPQLIKFVEAINLVIFLSLVSILSMVAIALRRRDQDEIQRQSISLRQSEERFHLISYATNDVVWDWNLISGEVWRNQGIERLFGYPEEETRPDYGWWEGCMHPEEREKIVESIRAAVDGGETFWSKEYRIQHADGSYVYVFDRAYIIHDESGKPVRMLGAIMDITARRQAEDVLRQESLLDPLTGLYNRRYMEEMLTREIRRAERSRQPISVIMLDIDHFKQVNDTLGHAAGDALLHNLAGFLLKRVRGADIACRYGGDEFILILPGASLEIAQQRAGHICEEAKNITIEAYDKLSGKCTLSLGIAVFPDQGSTPKEIFAAADAALYTAKEAGRNQVSIAKGKKGE